VEGSEWLFCAAVGINPRRNPHIQAKRCLKHTRVSALVMQGHKAVRHHGVNVKWRAQIGCFALLLHVVTLDRNSAGGINPRYHPHVQAKRCLKHIQGCLHW
jgi:hypothetical protein